ncbi:hypothetical protein CPB83DRAFT_843691 [Crepidotus variabilis]|uniref:Uncharacterized protein n=1 Tax=Crepidotus variabilis TaxID=179855 RepID=A0A9P6JVL3_9AGAR|nr:hypothetical protein CPB83DRAFT_843691 [Crepidotus variabilis]
MANTSHIGHDDVEAAPSKLSQPDAAPPSYSAVVAGDSNVHGRGLLPPQGYLQPIPYTNTHSQDFYNQYSQAHQHQFGPTPISNSLPLLPYAYHQSMAEADRRTSWRFVTAVGVGLGLYLLMGGVVGMEVGGVW